MSLIRKLSIVGSNYPEGGMHFQVGKTIGTFEISEIKMVETPLFEIMYDVYVKDGTSTVLWKTIHNVPVVVEYSINFD